MLEKLKEEKVCRTVYENVEDHDMYEKYERLTGNVSPSFYHYQVLFLYLWNLMLQTLDILNIDYLFLQNS